MKFEVKDLHCLLCFVFFLVSLLATLLTLIYFGKLAMHLSSSGIDVTHLGQFSLYFI